MACRVLVGGFLALSLLLVAEKAQAESGFYLGAEGGWSEGGADLNDRLAATPLMAAALGYRFSEHFRADVSIGYRAAYAVGAVTRFSGSRLQWDSHVRALVGMANVYVDLFHWGRLRPYVGAGLGVARKSVDEIAVRDLQTGLTGRMEGATDTTLAWQAGLGTGINLAPGWVLDAGYRYTGLGEARSGDTLTVGGTRIATQGFNGTVNAHELHLGLRYQF